MKHIPSWVYWIISALILSGVTDVFATKFQNTSVNAAILVNNQRTERHAEYYQLELGILIEYSDLGSPSSVFRTYTWGLDLIGTLDGAGGVGGLLMINDAEQGTQYVCYDGNGNVVALVNAATGAVTARYEYSPFGELIRMTGPMSRRNPFRFSTKYTDDETDLVYYGYRYYSPNLGRWISRDPIGEEGGINLYGFVRNDSISFVDSWGLKIRPHEQLEFEFMREPSPRRYGPRQMTEDEVFRTIKQLERANTFGKITGIGPGYEPIQPRQLELPLQITVIQGPANARCLIRDSQSSQNAPPAIPVTVLHGAHNPRTRLAAIRGSTLHSDQPGNLPDQLRSMYPETQFSFTLPGQPGQDVKVIGGMHPSAYPYGNWPNNVNYADFKPDTLGGYRTFRYDQLNKWPTLTHMLRYSPKTGKLIE